MTADDPAISEPCHQVAKTFARLGALYSETDIRLEDPAKILPYKGSWPQAGGG